ncbi:MAG: hypothetical protein EOO52_13400 [Gammaproteobacteria bacterium]|nr:MAG: hypothetical protein EOO52_13400 [Gammaproteobacteria bacterium]
MFKEKLAGFSAKAVDQVDAVRNTGNDYMEKNWASIRHQIKTRLHVLSAEHLEDRSTLTGVFQTVYEMLPFAVRIFLGEDAFINYCFSNIEKLHLSVGHAVNESEQLSLCDQSGTEIQQQA